MKVEKIWHPSIFLATCRNLGQNLAIFFCIEIWREKAPKTAKFSPIWKTIRQKKTPCSRECKCGRVLGFGDLGKRSVHLDAAILSCASGTGRKKIAGKTTTNNYRHWLSFMIFLRLRCQWVGPLEDCQKKTFFYRQLHFQGLRALQRRRDWEGLMWKGLRGLRKFFFPISDVASF